MVTLALTEMTSWGVLYYAFTVFINPMHASFHWSRSEMTGAFSLALLVSALAGIPVGRWLDRHGPRMLMTLGSCAAALLVLAWASVQNLAQFYVVWLFIGLAMAAVLYEPAFVVVATWFRRRRGQALTVLTLVAGLASVIYVPLAGLLVAGMPWRRAIVVLALLLAAGTILPHAFVLRRGPEQMGLLPDGAAGAPPEAAARSERSVGARDAMHGATFWLLVAAFLLNALGIGAMQVHLVPYLIDRGQTPQFAAQMIGLTGIMALPGRLVLTPLGERVPRSIIACCIFLLQALALLALLVTSSIVGIAAFVVLFGAGFGAVTPARAALVGDFYGAANYGAISGALAFFLTGSRGVAPVAAAALYDLTGGYHSVLLALVGTSMLAAVLVLLAERSGRSLRPTATT
ncbi:MAG TPA: MFS transporter [Dehalococcoidia bacterium]|nr:MFS transporter [Dehalococcoidia bacterium]